MVTFGISKLFSKEFYGLRYGKYNVSLYPSDTYDKKANKFYHLLQIDKFDKANNFVGKKCFYLEDDKELEIICEADVDRIYANMNRSIL